MGIERIQGYLKSRRFLQRYSDDSLTRLKMWGQIAWVITKREPPRNKYNRITKIKGITRPLITVLRVSSWKFTIYLKENNLSLRNCRACVSNPVLINMSSVSAINLSLFISGSRIFHNSILAFQTTRFEEKYLVKSLILALGSIK